MNDLCRLFFLLIVSATLMFASAVSAGEEFEWAFGQEVSDVPPPSPKVAVEPSPANGDFQWSWGDQDIPQKTEAPVPTKTDSSHKSIDNEAYQKLLKENLELRKQMSEALRDEEVSRLEKDKLSAEVKDLEVRIAQLVGSIKAIQKEQSEPESPDNMNELETRLAQAERERNELQAELQRLKNIALKEDHDPKMTESVTKDSDLFRNVERENALLKKKLQEIESERRRLAQERDVLAKEKERTAELAKKTEKKVEVAAVKLAESEKEKKALAMYAKQVPEMENELAVLKKAVVEREQSLFEKQKQLDGLKQEVDRRDVRLEKAERMAELLEKTREDLKLSADREKKDMHYNMAVVYAKEGRIKEAEAEYLKALRIDPGDADVHYNLGILYDEEIGDKQKAAIHYRRYIVLRPSASDVDEVKGWLINLDVGR